MQQHHPPLRRIDRGRRCVSDLHSRRARGLHTSAWRGVYPDNSPHTAGHVTADMPLARIVVLDLGVFPGFLGITVDCGNTFGRLVDPLHCFWYRESALVLPDELVISVVQLFVRSCSSSSCW